MTTRLRDPIYKKCEDLQVQTRWQTALIQELQEKIKRKDAELEAYKGPSTPAQVYREQRGRLANLNAEVLSECRLYCEANQTAGIIIQKKFIRWLHTRNRPITEKTNDDTITARLRELKKDGLLGKAKVGVYKLV